MGYNNAPSAQIIKPKGRQQTSGSWKKWDRKHKVFAAEYVIDYDGVRAAIKAGYSKANASNQARKLLKLKHIQAYVNSHQTQVIKRAKLTEEMIEEQLVYAITQNQRDFLDPETGEQITDFSKLPERALNVLQSVKIEYAEPKKGRSKDTGKGRPKKTISSIEYTRVSKIAALKLACQKLGLLVKDKTPTSITIDFSGLTKPPTRGFPIDERLKLEEG